MKVSSVYSAADFSADRLCRFSLVRCWASGPLEERRLVNFIMLNPSTAGEQRNDTTVSKCMGFARAWGYNGIAVTNLSPVVSTDPAGLPPWRGLDPENTRALKHWIDNSALLVAAWGSQPREIERRIAIPELILHVRTLASPAVLYCIGETLRGSPLHPSRAPYTTAPVLWRSALE